MCCKVFNCLFEMKFSWPTSLDFEFEDPDLSRHFLIEKSVCLETKIAFL
jgi:hypothetical protein